MTFRRRLACATILSTLAPFAFLGAAPAFAQSRVITTPNVTNASGSTSVTLNGITFTNQGLMGAGRLDANTRDFRGETLGSFSGMSINLNTWRRNADGSYSGSIFTLPDRGPFDGGIDYRDRVHTSDITFRPLAAGSAALPQATTSQNQLTISPTGGFVLTDTTGSYFTGRDPGASTVTRNGIVYPLATDGTAAGHISLDPEAIAFLPNGNFYVSDEYSAGIFLFDPSGRQIGVIQAPNALLPRNAQGVIDFNSVNPGVVGRRNNQGLEAMALTPDYGKLVTILQSATVQDTNGANQQTRNNTRILIYDISNNATPTNPIGHYVLQLPTFNNAGSGGAADRTAAQSEMLALNDTQFLVLSRDGLGRGVAANASASTTPLFKSILLVDITGATNLAGTAFETGTNPIATNGTLNSSIVPVQQVELINMLNPTQLARVGMNITRLPTSSPTTISEKIEAMALAPVLDEANPQDFFLFVGNDNDFQATQGFFNGAPATLGALDGTGNNDSVMLIYRLTLPTYVDPLALAAMKVNAPRVLVTARTVSADLGSSLIQPTLGMLGNLRRVSPDARGVRTWIEGDFNRRETPLGTAELNTQSLGFVGGVDYGYNGLRAGFAIGYRELDGRFGGASLVEAQGTTLGGYVSYNHPSGLYLQAIGSGALDLRIDTLRHDTAYGQTATGAPDADAWAAGGEIGWQLPFGRVHAGPFAAIEHVDVTTDAFRQTGASLANIAFNAGDYQRTTYTLGFEGRAVLNQAVQPMIRIGYAFESEEGDATATYRLASAQHSMATVTSVLPSTEEDRLVLGAGVEGSQGIWSWRIHGEGRLVDDEMQDVRVSAGIAAVF